jgi:hypothetical protein
VSSLVGPEMEGELRKDVCVVLRSPTPSLTVFQFLGAMVERPPGHLRRARSSNHQSSLHLIVASRADLAECLFEAVAFEDEN